MKLTLRYFWLLICIILTQNSFSQTLPDNYISLDITSGLSQNGIYVIHQDANGFIWIGTHDGLNRYDGYDFKVYRYDPFDSTSISDINVNDLIEDQFGNLIIATNRGINKFDREKEIFTTISKNNQKGKDLPTDVIYTLYRDKFDIIWVGTTQGIAKYKPETDEIIPVKSQIIKDYGIDNSVIWKILVDKKSNVWIGTSYRGLYKYNPTLGTIKAYYRWLPEFDEMNSNSITSLFEDEDGHIWVGTYNGINKINPKTDEIKSYLYKDIDYTLDGISVQSLLKTSKGTLVAGTADFGLYIYDPETDNFVPEDVVPNESGFLSGRSYPYLHEDKGGTLWMGTRNRGIRVVDLYQKPFHHMVHIPNDPNSLLENSVYTIVEDHNKDFWIGTLVGLSKIDHKTGLFTHYLRDENDLSSLSDNRIWGVFESSTHDIYVATSHGMNILDRRTNKFERFITDYKDDNQISDNELFIFNEDKDGKIWIGTFYGLSVFDPKTKSFKNYYPDSEDENSLSGAKVWCIHIDNDNQIWIGTNNGFNKYIPESDHFIVYKNIPGDTTSISHNDVYSMHEDQDGELWLGTSGFGINKFNKESEIFKNYNIHDGLPNNTIYSILSHNENIWFTTNNGLVRLNKNTEEITTFNHKDGLQSNEFNFAHLKHSNGKMYFGGVNGITSFIPDSIHPRDYMPNFVFTSFKINNTEVSPGQEYSGIVPLSKSIDLTEKLELTHKVDIFSLEFAILNYSVSGKINYRYKIDELNPDWINIGQQRSINFTGLKPGTYHLHIMGTNQDGVWMKEPRVLQIIIHPPWWRSNWFLIIEFIILIGLILLIIIIREKKLKYDKRILERTVGNRTEEIEKQKEEIEAQKEHIEEQNIQLELHKTQLEEKVEQRTAELRLSKEKAEESDRLKSAFLANMSHEIRTPLNAVVGFSELMTSPATTKDEIHQFVSLIKSSSNDLLNLINDIIDIAKIESGQLKINLSDGDINRYFPELFEIFQRVIIKEGKANVELKFHCDRKDKFLIKTDHKRIKQVLSNLINNAIKFTDQGHVDFGYYIKDSMIHFYVEDTGIGIPKESREHIFERFRKIDKYKERLYGGTGLGLAISKNIITLLGGDIWVESEINKGSKFHFEIPLVETTREDDESQESDSGQVVESKVKKVLICEDDKDSLKYLEVLFDKSRIQFVTAIDGQEAIKLFKNEKDIDLVLLDIKMPVMDGFETIIAIREISPSIPVIAQTAFAMNEDHIEMEKAGFNAILNKPILPNELVKILNKIY